MDPGKQLMNDRRRCEEFLYCVEAAGYASDSAASGRACGRRSVPPCAATYGNDSALAHPMSALRFEPLTRRRSARGASAHGVSTRTAQNDEAVCKRSPKGITIRLCTFPLGVEYAGAPTPPPGVWSVDGPRWGTSGAVNAPDSGGRRWCACILNPEGECA